MINALAEWLDNSLVLDEPSTCWICGDSTVLIEVNFEAPLCSLACNEEAWAMWDRAMRRGDAASVIRGLQCFWGLPAWWRLADSDSDDFQTVDMQEAWLEDLPF